MLLQEVFLRPDDKQKPHISISFRLCNESLLLAALVRESGPCATGAPALRKTSMARDGALVRVGSSGQVLTFILLSQQAALPIVRGPMGGAFDRTGECFCARNELGMG